MKTETLRKALPLVVLLIAAIAWVMAVPMGTITALGIGSFTLLCPLGALAAMLASKTVIPQAVISIVIGVLLVVLFARAFCAWLCPTPAVSRLRDFFGGKKKDAEEVPAEKTAANTEPVLAASGVKAAVALTAEEKATLAKACGSDSCEEKSCSACAPKRGQGIDSRHVVLGSALVSSLIFGFPVFCLVCPVGLAFATIFLLITLFTQGDVSWLVVAVPALLIAEVVLFRKWCHKLCPLGAIMSLVSKANRTFVPVINDDKCLETAKCVTCGRCGAACGEGIDLRHPELSTAVMNECTKCRACADVCPGKAITFPVFAPSASKAKSAAGEALPVLDDDEPSVAL